MNNAGNFALRPWYNAIKKPIDHPMRFRLAKWTCDRLTEDGDFGKKKSSFQMKLILILAGMETSKIVAFGA